jgi:hypothetical protein
MNVSLSGTCLRFSKVYNCHDEKRDLLLPSSDRPNSSALELARPVNLTIERNTIVAVFHSSFPGSDRFACGLSKRCIKDEGDMDEASSWRCNVHQSVGDILRQAELL